MRGIKKGRKISSSAGQISNDHVNYFRLSDEVYDEILDAVNGLNFGL